MKKLNRAVVFDCFGTVFNASTLTEEDVRAYNDHVRGGGEYTPYESTSGWYNLVAHPDSAEGIKILQDAGITCIALSNGSLDLIEHLSFINGIKFDHIVDLAKYKVYKPDLEAYKTVEKETGFLPCDCAFVTANPTFGDVEGSKSIGMIPFVIRNSDSGYGNIVDFANMTVKLVTLLDIMGHPVDELSC